MAAENRLDLYALLNLQGFRITDLGTPTMPGDAATMAYVDAQGVDLGAVISEHSASVAYSSGDLVYGNRQLSTDNFETTIYRALGDVAAGASLPTAIGSPTLDWVIVLQGRTSDRTTIDDLGPLASDDRFGPTRYEAAVGDLIQFEEFISGTSEAFSSAVSRIETMVAANITAEFRIPTGQTVPVYTGHFIIEFANTTVAGAFRSAASGRYIVKADTVENRIVAAVDTNDQVVPADTYSSPALADTIDDGDFGAGNAVTGLYVRFKGFNSDGDSGFDTVEIDSDDAPGTGLPSFNSAQVGILSNVQLAASVAAVSELPDVVINGQVIILDSVDDPNLPGVYLGVAGEWEPRFVSPITIAAAGISTSVTSNEVVLAGGTYYRNISGGGLQVVVDDMGDVTTDLTDENDWLIVLEGGSGGGVTEAFETNTTQFVEIQSTLSRGNGTALALLSVGGTADPGPLEAGSVALINDANNTPVEVIFTTPFDLLTTRGYEDWVDGIFFQAEQDGFFIRGTITDISDTQLTINATAGNTTTLTQNDWNGQIGTNAANLFNSAGSVEIFAPFTLDDDAVGVTNTVDSDITVLTRNDAGRVTEVSGVDLVETLQGRGVTSIDVHVGEPNTFTLATYLITGVDGDASTQSTITITFNSEASALDFYEGVTGIRRALVDINVNSVAAALPADTVLLIEPNDSNFGYIEVPFGSGVSLRRDADDAGGRHVFTLIAPTADRTRFNNVQDNLDGSSGGFHRTIVTTTQNSVHSTGDVHLVGADGVSVTRVEENDPLYFAESNGIKISTSSLSNRLDHLTEEISNLLSDSNAVDDDIVEFITFTTTGPVDTSQRVGNEMETFADFNSRAEEDRILTTEIDMGISDIIEGAYQFLTDAEKNQVACVVIDFSATQADLVNDILLPGRDGSGANLTFTRNDTDPLSSDSEWTCLNGFLAVEVSLVDIFTDVEFYSEIQQPSTPDQTVFGSYDPANTAQLAEVTALDGLADDEFFRIYMQLGAEGINVSLDATQSATFVNTDFFGSYVSFDTDFEYDVNGARVRDLTPTPRTSFLVYPEGLGISAFAAVLRALEEERTLLTNNDGTPRFSAIDDSWIDGQIAREDQIFGELHPDSSFYLHSTDITAYFDNNTTQDLTSNNASVFDGDQLDIQFNRTATQIGDDVDNGVAGAFVAGTHYAIGIEDDSPLVTMILTDIVNIPNTTVSGLEFTILTGYDVIRSAFGGRTGSLGQSIFNNWYSQIADAVATGDVMTFGGYAADGQPFLTNTAQSQVVGSVLSSTLPSGDTPIDSSWLTNTPGSGGTVAIDLASATNVVPVNGIAVVNSTNAFANTGGTELTVDGTAIDSTSSVTIGMSFPETADWIRIGDGTTGTSSASEYISNINEPTGTPSEGSIITLNEDLDGFEFSELPFQTALTAGGDVIVTISTELAADLLGNDRILNSAASSLASEFTAISADTQNASEELPYVTTTTYTNAAGTVIDTPAGYLTITDVNGLADSARVGDIITSAATDDALGAWTGTIIDLPTPSDPTDEFSAVIAVDNIDFITIVDPPVVGTLLGTFEGVSGSQVNVDFDASITTTNQINPNGDATAYYAGPMDGSGFYFGNPDTINLAQGFIDTPFSIVQGGRASVGDNVFLLTNERFYGFTPTAGVGTNDTSITIGSGIQDANSVEVGTELRIGSYTPAVIVTSTTDVSGNPFNPTINLNAEVGRNIPGQYPIFRLQRSARSWSDPFFTRWGRITPGQFGNMLQTSDDGTNRIIHSEITQNVASKVGLFLGEQLATGTISVIVDGTATDITVQTYRTGDTDWFWFSEIRENANGTFTSIATTSLGLGMWSTFRDPQTIEAFNFNLIG